MSPPKLSTQLRTSCPLGPGLLSPLTLVFLASSCARLAGLDAERKPGSVTVADSGTLDSGLADSLSTSQVASGQSDSSVAVSGSIFDGAVEASTLGTNAPASNSSVMYSATSETDGGAIHGHGWPGSATHDASSFPTGSVVGIHPEDTSAIVEGSGGTTDAGASWETSSSRPRSGSSSNDVSSRTDVSSGYPTESLDAGPTTDEQTTDLGIACGSDSFEQWRETSTCWQQLNSAGITDYAIEDGRLVLSVSSRSAFWTNLSGVALYQMVDAADFIVEAHVRVRRSGTENDAPLDGFSSAGLVLRDPAHETDMYVSATVGRDETDLGVMNRCGADGSSRRNTSFTTNSNAAWLRMCRLEGTLRVYHRLTEDDPWTQATWPYEPCPTLPQRLQVGVSTNRFGFDAAPVDGVFDDFRLATGDDVLFCTQSF